MIDLLRNPESVKRSVEKIANRLFKDKEVPYHQRRTRRIQVGNITYTLTPSRYRYRLSRVKRFTITPGGQRLNTMAYQFPSKWFNLDEFTLKFVTKVILDDLYKVYEKHARELMEV